MFNSSHRRYAPPSCSATASPTSAPLSPGPPRPTACLSSRGSFLVQLAIALDEHSPRSLDSSRRSMSMWVCTDLSVPFPPRHRLYALRLQLLRAGPLPHARFKAFSLHKTFSDSRVDRSRHRNHRGRPPKLVISARPSGEGSHRFARQNGRHAMLSTDGNGCREAGTMTGCIQLRSTKYGSAESG